MGSEVQEYYSDAHVRERIRRFLMCGEELSAQAVAHGCEPPQALEAHQLWDNLQPHDELHRSLWDRRGLLAHLDIEHVHFQDPWYSWDHPAEAFQAQEPVVNRALELLEDWGIQPLHILTGRGHHLIWRIDAESEAFARLGRLAPLHAAQQGCWARLRRLMSGSALIPGMHFWRAACRQSYTSCRDISGWCTPVTTAVFTTIICHPGKATFPG